MHNSNYMTFWEMRRYGDNKIIGNYHWVGSAGG
jgi:hypothetical protein